MRVYHFCNKQFGLENIQKRRLKVSTFLAVNDPFEFICHNLSDINLRQQMLKFRESIAATHGMICFSESKESPVQWAHYSDRHTGICLGFDIPDEFLTKVNYTKSRLDFRFTLSTSSGDFNLQTNEMFTTKYEHWAYEQEYRIFGDLGEPDKTSGLYFKNFDEYLVLREIAVGYNSDITRADISKRIENLTNKVDSYKVRPAFTSFRMIRNKDKSLWK